MNYNPTTTEDFRAVLAFHGKKVRELTPPLRTMVDALFDHPNEDSMMECDVCNRFSKPDIFIKINGKTRFISLKSGHSNTMHVEKLKTLIPFFRNLGVSKETLKTILLFHFGDGTLNGTGERRMYVDEVMAWLGERVKSANAELARPEIVKASIDRFVFDGSEHCKASADVLAFGTPEYFIFATREALEEVVMKKDYSHIRALHIGPMLLQPFSRDINRLSKHPEKREAMSLHWHYLMSDIQKAKLYEDYLRIYPNKRKNPSHGVSHD